jgi:ubiquinone/menaquinone biosynthesis C-methylase UbiE
VIRPGLHVLDLGCGLGDDACELADRGCRVVALDSQADRVRQVPRLPEIELRITGDLAGHLPFRGEAFDLIVASLSLHYLDTETTKVAIAEVARVLREGCRLICRVNARGDVNFGYGQGEEVEPEVFRQPEGHLKRFFTPEMLERFLRPCFTVDRIAPRTILQNGREKRTLECLARKK